MALSFPTLAEQAANEFHNSKVTISVPSIAKRMGATISKAYPRRYFFDDDSSLQVTGRGANHKIETFLP